MSARMVGLVFERYPEGGGEFALALALADHAHDDGTHIFAYVATLAQKSRQSTRTVQYQLDRMLRRGFLLRVGEGHGGRSRAASYRISPNWISGGELVALEKKGAISAPFVECESPVDNLLCDGTKGATVIAPFENDHAAERVQSTTEKGAIAVAPAIEPYEPIQNTNTPQPPSRGADPALTPSAPKNRGRVVRRGAELDGLMGLDEWLGRCEAIGEAPVPFDHPVHGYAEAAGIGPDLLALAFAEWVQLHRSDTKRHRSYPDAFAKAVRGNHLRLWFIPTGEKRAQLTTQGRQARAVHGSVPLLRPGVVVAGKGAVTVVASSNAELERMAADKAHWQANKDSANLARLEAMTVIRQNLKGAA